jgi:hypothetical protein
MAERYEYLFDLIFPKIGCKRIEREFLRDKYDSNSDYD